MVEKVHKYWFYELKRHWETYVRRTPRRAARQKDIGDKSKNFFLLYTLFVDSFYGFFLWISFEAKQ
jgi:hypothetical protein